MRLTEHQKTAIREAVTEIFGSDAEVLLFGSRTNDAVKGGDIDLLVRSGKPVQQRERKILQLVAKLQIRLGDQPIDVLVLDPATVRQSIHEEALRSGVKL
jgi:predicted nucleotidyltransferase